MDSVEIGQMEAVASVDADVGAHERQQPFHVGVEHRIAASGQCDESTVLLDGVPHYNTVEHQPQRRELVLGSRRNAAALLANPQVASPINRRGGIAFTSMPSTPTT